MHVYFFLPRNQDIVQGRGYLHANTQVRIEILSKLTKFQNGPAYLHAEIL